MSRQDRKRRSGRQATAAHEPAGRVHAEAAQASVRERQSRVEDAVLEAITAEGYDLVELKLDGRRQLRVTIDLLPGPSHNGGSQHRPPSGRLARATPYDPDEPYAAAEPKPRRGKPRHDAAKAGAGGGDAEAGAEAEARALSASASADELDDDADADADTAGAPARRSVIPPKAPRVLPRGVRIDDCQTVSHIVAAALNGMGHDAGAFHIEVTSPGVDRPLTRPEHFARFRGAQVTVTLKRAGVDGRKNFTGELLTATDDDVTLHVLDTTGPTTFARRDIQRVRLRPDIEAPPRPAPRSGKKSGRHKRGGA